MSPRTSGASPLEIGVLAVVPSPYQRDIFAAMHARDDMRLRVFYLENQSPDSPWPLEPLRDYERVLDGRWFSLGSVRWHQCRRTPQPEAFDFFIVNSFMSSPAQALMRRRQPSPPWAFWGERLRGQHKSWKRLVQRTLTAPLSRASLIAGIGSLAANDYRRKFPGVPVANIPYHCSLDEFRKNPARPGGRGDGVLRVLFCGQMIARKGLDVLLEAFARLAPQMPALELALVGREAGLPAMLSGLPPSTRSRIDYRGFKPPGALPAEFARADLFVLPSRHDGWGVVVNQALGAGLPIVCTEAVGAAHDLINPGINGVMTAPDDAGALESAMADLLASPQRLAEMGAASLAMADDWTPVSGAQRWAGALREALKNRERAA